VGKFQLAGAIDESQLQVSSGNNFFDKLGHCYVWQKLK
jgi:hypothetical protein